MTADPFGEYPRRTGENTTPSHYAGVRWGVREIVIGGVAVVASLFTVLVIAAIIIAALDIEENTAEAFAAQVVTSLIWDLLIIAIVVALASSKGSTWQDLGLRPPEQPGRLAAMIGLGYVACIAAVQVYGIILNGLGLEDLLPDQQLPDEIYDFTGVLIAFAVVGVSVVPFAEELFFRGFFFAGLRPKLGFVLAGLISGFVFSLAHADFGLIIPFTAVGMILAYAYERSGTLLAPIGIHIIFNAVSFIILILVPEARQ